MQTIMHTPLPSKSSLLARRQLLLTQSHEIGLELIQIGTELAQHNEVERKYNRRKHGIR